MSVTQNRTVEDVEQLMEKAKVDHNGVNKVSQSLLCGDSLRIDDKSMILLELNDPLLKSLQIGEEFIIRGDNDESAVLCTRNQTYDFKEAQTSNSLLVLPEFTLPNPNDTKKGDRQVIERKVSNIFHNYYEVKKCQPKLAKLRRLLEENPYQGPEYEEDNIGNKYTLKNLLNHIQASEEELIIGLNRLPAFYIKGYYRVLDYDYQFRIVNYIFNLMDENSYGVNELPRSVMISTLEELAPREIIESCFDLYTEPSLSREDIYHLKEDKVCKFFAETLLRASGKFHLGEFLESWQKSVPDGLTTNLSQLRGMALTDYLTKPAVIFYYPVWNLPEDINKRFDTLFRKRSKWSYSDITPYIEDLTTDTLNVNALLTKHARSSVENGVKMFNSKHSIQ